LRPEESSCLIIGEGEFSENGMFGEDVRFPIIKLSNTSVYLQTLQTTKELKVKTC